MVVGVVEVVVAEVVVVVEVEVVGSSSTSKDLDKMMFLSSLRVDVSKFTQTFTC